MDKLLKLNDIFSNLSGYAKKHKLKIRNVKNGLTLEDVMLYKMMIIEKNKTKQGVTNNINYENIKESKKKKHRTLFYKKEKHLSLPFFQNICDDVFKLCIDVCSIDFNNLVPIYTDGTVTHSKINNKSGELELSTNMGYTIGSQNIPLDLTYNGPKRNSEIANLMSYIKEHKLKNVFFVCDRAYFSYKLFKFIEDEDLSFIIRIKRDSLISKKDQAKIDKSSNSKLIKEISLVSRIVTYETNGYKIVSTTKGTRKIKIKSTIELITNLIEKDVDGNYIFTDADILAQYKMRWNVEIFFKFVKKCFKFEAQNESSCDENEKNNKCILILTYICNMISFLYTKEHNIQKEIIGDKRKKTKTKNCVTRVQSINQSQLIDGIFSKLLPYLVKGELTIEILNNFVSNYVIIVVNEDGRSFERVCISPFKKWYIKQYAIRYQWSKIIDAIENDTISKLNKNLKLIANNVLKIIKLNAKND